MTGAYVLERQVEAMLFGFATVNSGCSQLVTILRIDPPEAVPVADDNSRLIRLAHDGLLNHYYRSVISKWKLTRKNEKSLILILAEFVVESRGLYKDYTQLLASRRASVFPLGKRSAEFPSSYIVVHPVPSLSRSIAGIGSFVFSPD